MSYDLLVAIKRFCQQSATTWSPSAGWQFSRAWNWSRMLIRHHRVADIASITTHSLTWLAEKTSECHFLAHFLRFCIEKKVFSILRTKGFSCKWICKNKTMKVTSVTQILMWFARSVSLPHHVKDLNLSSPGLVTNQIYSVRSLQSETIVQKCVWVSIRGFSNVLGPTR